VKGTVTGIFRRFLDADTARENDQVGERDFLPAGLSAVELALNAFQCGEHFRQLSRLVDLPILLRS
jgi:hypothetical protein